VSGATVASAADQAFCVSDVNRYRMTAGRPALVESSSVDSFAQAAAQNDSAVNSAHDYFIKHFPDGAENEYLRQGANGAQGAFSTLDGLSWSEGPSGGHYQNMTANWSSVGCGAYKDGAVWTAVIDFR
jgi:hypothetical protein